MESNFINTKKIICFVAGKSGGHIIPCLTLAHYYLNTKNMHATLFISTNTNLDTQLLSNNSSVTHHVLLPITPYTSLWRLPLVLITLGYAFIKSIYQLYNYKPYKIISTGGIVSIPVCYAAKLLQIPFELHELNATPGRAITHLAPWAKAIFVCFEQTKNYFKSLPCIKTNYPIRFSIQPVRALAYTNVGIDPHKKTILIIGGSQGSVFLNMLFTQWLDAQIALWQTIQVVHQTGINDQKNWVNWYQLRGIKAVVFSYNHNMADIYATADVIICRAGAGILFEGKFFNKPCLVIPLELSSTAHQKDNAFAMATEYPHLFSVLRQIDITHDHHIFDKTLRRLLGL